MKKILFLSIFVLSLKAQATEMVGALSAGMGGTGRAAIESNETLFLNPAGLALFDKFYTGFSYLSGFTGKDISRNTYSVTLTDGTSGLMMPGSFSYRRHKINDRGRSITENEFKGGMGYRLSPRLSLGLAGTYLKAEAFNGEAFTQSNFDAGVLIGLRPNWGLSITGQNLLQQDDNIPDSLRRLSRVALGTQYIFQRRVTFRYETLSALHVDNSQLLAHRFGVSASMKGNFYLNGGYSVDDTLAQNWTSVGLAWRGPRLKLAYSLQNEDRQDLGTRHFVDFWLDI